MNLQEITEDKKELLKDLIEPVREKLFKDLEDDEDYELSTDEVTELVDNMIIVYLTPVK